MTNPESSPHTVHLVHPGIVSVEDGEAIQYIGFVELCRRNGLDPQSPNVLNAVTRGIERRLENAEVRHYSTESCVQR